MKEKLTPEAVDQRVAEAKKLISGGMPVRAAIAQVGITPHSYYYRQQAKAKKVARRSPVKRKSPSFQPTQVVVAKDKNVNIVIMKGDQDVVQQIAKSLSWLGDLND